MRCICRAITAVCVLARLGPGVVGAASPAAAAAPCVQIYRIAYNSPGPDNRSNTSLNGEWVQLHNRCSTASTLTHARLRDAAGHTYTFGRYTLGPGTYLKIHTGRGTNTAANRYWQLRNYVWNNTGDTALLYSPAGKLIDKCSWGYSHASSRYR